MVIVLPAVTTPIGAVASAVPPFKSKSFFTGHKPTDLGDRRPVGMQGEKKILQLSSSLVELNVTNGLNRLRN